MVPGFSPLSPLCPVSTGQFGGRCQGSHGALLDLQENSIAVNAACLVDFIPSPRTRDLCLFRRATLLLLNSEFLALKWLHKLSTPPDPPLVFLFLLSELGVSGHRPALRGQ